jgi:hypothetical protein
MLTGRTKTEKDTGSETSCMVLCSRNADMQAVSTEGASEHEYTPCIASLVENYKVMIN